MKKFQKFLSQTIEKHLSRLDWDFLEEQPVPEDVVSEIDADSIAAKIVSEMENKIFTFQQMQSYTEPICGTCYRMFGEWVTPSGGKLSEQEVNKTGTRIFFTDDF